MPMPSPKLLMAAAVAASLLAACERKATAPAPAPAAPPAATPVAPVAPPPLTLPTGFQHDPAIDASGYMMPQAPIKVGTLRLTTIALGAPSDFKQWERGEREGLFGPIFLDFEDEATPTVVNELGAEVHTGRIRVLPTAYSLRPGAFSFRGTDPKLGEIGFSGVLDTAALTAAKAAGPGDSRLVLTGALVIGETRFETARFTYYMGD